MKNRIFSLVFVFLLMVGLALPSAAIEVPENRIAGCSIDVTVKHDGTNIKDGELTAIRVGYIDHEGNNYFFRTVFDDTIIEDVDSPDTAIHLRESYDAEKHDHIFYKQTVPIKNGIASFTELDSGLYLIIQETASTGYNPLSPFLVSVPYWDGTQYHYDVDAKVKTELQKEPTPPTDDDDDSDAKPPPLKKLPQTGQLTWPIPWMALSGMALFAAGWWLCFSSRKDQNEK